MRIGVFLGASPTHGGVFQYSDAVLEAVAAYKSPGSTIVVRFLDPAWLPLLASYGLTGSVVARGRLRRLVDAVLWRLPIPVVLWRRSLSHVHSITRALLADACDLWILPAQDIWTYMTPVPTLGSVHDLMHRYEPQFPEVSQRGMYRKRERHYRNMCRWAAGILVDSVVGRDQLLESYEVTAALFVLPYIAPKHARSPSSPRRSLDGIPDKYLFYPAQFWQHKNHRRLVDAVALLRDRYPEIRLVLVGSPKNGYQELRASVLSLGLSEQVLFLDYVPDADMAELYERARALVMPTFFGPTNIPQLEAFALGCPVATSRIYGIPDQVGDAALLFDPNSTEEIAAAMERLWTDDELCRVLSERGRQRNEAGGARQFAERLNDIVLSMLPARVAE